MIAAVKWRPGVRAGVVALFVLVCESTRAEVAQQPGLTLAALLVGGAALGLAALGWPAERLALGTSKLGLRIFGGLATGAVLLLPAAVRSGSTVLWTLAHVLSHPPEFLGAVAAAGLLLALWRWACKDLVAPILGHVIADLAL